jgi:hypothetical protein
MTEAKISISRICSDPDALKARHCEIQAVLYGTGDIFSEEDRIQAKQEEQALHECLDLIGKSMDARLEYNWKEAGDLLNRAYCRNGEEPPIPGSSEAGYALHRGTHPLQVQTACATRRATTERGRPAN